MALALAAPAALPVSALVLALAALLAAAPHESDSVRIRAAGLERQARNAVAHGEWNEAAELWRDALLIDERGAERWVALAHALTAAGRHRESVAAYQRAIQLDASTMRDGSWRIARAYALAGNDKQAARWLASAARLGIAGREELWNDPVFDRYRNDPVFRRAIAPMGEHVSDRARGGAVRRTT